VTALDLVILVPERSRMGAALSVVDGCLELVERWWFGDWCSGVQRYSRNELKVVS